MAVVAVMNKITTWVTEAGTECTDQANAAAQQLYEWLAEAGLERIDQKAVIYKIAENPREWRKVINVYVRLNIEPGSS